MNRVNLLAINGLFHKIYKKQNNTLPHDTGIKEKQCGTRRRQKMQHTDDA